MIPKTIHYCWFGEEMPDRCKKIVEGWKRLMPDYNFYHWGNEHIHDYPVKFVRQATRKGHYAFIADYFRLRKVHEHGGFYMDTDMLLIKRLDEFLEKEFIIGSEVEGRISWGIFGSSRSNNHLKQCYEKYHNLEYDQFKPPVIPYFLNDLTLAYVAEYPEKRLNLPPEFFYPMPIEKMKEDYQDFVRSETVGIHLWDFSWNKLRKDRLKIVEIIYRLKVLLKDLLHFDYSPYYFRINLIRIRRLLKSN